MFVTALLLGLVGVFCILDSRILGRMNFERPLILHHRRCAAQVICRPA